MAALENIEGKRFGKLTAVRYVGHIGGSSPRTAWECKCDCGGNAICLTTNLKMGTSKSCGCWKKEKSTKHGCGKPATPEYRSWHAMKSRCNNPNNAHYKNYGGRGITVCDEWKNDFTAFLNDMGKKPTTKHTLERIKNNKGYYKKNCRWATRKEQQNNLRTTRFIRFRGKVKPITEWAAVMGFSGGVIRERLKIGWSIKRALTTEVNKRSKSKQA